VISKRIVQFCRKLRVAAERAVATRFAIASLRDIRSCYYILDMVITEKLYLFQQPSTEARALAVTVPRHEWEWFESRPIDFRTAYCRLLHQFLLERLRQAQLPSEGWAEVILIPGNRWEVNLTKVPLQEASDKTGVHGFFLVPGGDPELGCALMVEWPYPAPPRVPNAQEAQQPFESLRDVLQSLTPAASQSERWQEGQEHTVCGRRVIFIWR
jgi:hypothetical protein